MKEDGRISSENKEKVHLEDSSAFISTTTHRAIKEMRKTEELLMPI